jgi:hypothetical protein
MKAEMDVGTNRKAFQINLDRQKSTGGSGQTKSGRRKLGKNGPAGSRPDHQRARVFRVSGSGCGLSISALRKLREDRMAIALQKAPARGTFPAT